MGIANFSATALRSTVQGWNLHPVAHNAFVYSMDVVMLSIVDKFFEELSRPIVARIMGVEPSRLANVTEKSNGGEIVYTQCTTSWLGKQKREVLEGYTGQEVKALRRVKLMTDALSLLTVFSPHIRAICFVFSETLGYSKKGAFSWKQQVCIMAVTGVAGFIFRKITAEFEVRYLSTDNKSLLARMTRTYVMPLWGNAGGLCFIGYALQMEALPTGSSIRDFFQSNETVARMTRGAFQVLK